MSDKAREDERRALYKKVRTMRTFEVSRIVLVTLLLLLQTSCASTQSSKTVKYVEICQGGATSDDEPIDANLLVAAGLMTVSGLLFLNNDPQTASGAYTALIAGAAFSWRSSLNRLPTREHLPCESILQRFKDDQKRCLRREPPFEAGCGRRYQP